MGVRNHKVKPGMNLDIAIIEGTKIEVFCGMQFVPSVTVGTSGRADVPGAPDCEACQELYDITVKWNRLRRERNRINRELYSLEKEHVRLREAERTKADAPEPTFVSAIATTEGAPA